ncbi:hypothetical protein BIV60_23055 [Bacillus sp. MUM 116]|nr:hypothetical protein BIV60_23055 [Bacillus sp. MUM 116]
MAVFVKFVVNEQLVDWNVGMLAFRGAGGEPPRRFAPVGSHLSRCSRRSFAPSVPINLLYQQFTLSKPIIKTTILEKRAFYFK